MSLTPFQAITVSNLSTVDFYQSGISYAATGDSQLYWNDGVVTITTKSPAFVFGEQVVGPLIRKVASAISSFWSSFLTLPGAEGAKIDEVATENMQETVFRYSDQMTAVKRAEVLQNYGRVQQIVSDADSVMFSLGIELDNGVQKQVQNYCRSVAKVQATLEDVLKLVTTGDLTEFSPGRISSLSLVFPIPPSHFEPAITGIVMADKNIVITHLFGRSLEPAGCMDPSAQWEGVGLKKFSSFIHLKNDLSLEEVQKLFSDESIRALEDGFNSWKKSSRNTRNLTEAIYKGLYEKDPAFRANIHKVFEDIYQHLLKNTDSNSYSVVKVIGLGQQTIEITKISHWNLLAIAFSLFGVNETIARYSLSTFLVVLASSHLWKQFKPKKIKKRGS